MFGKLVEYKNTYASMFWLMLHDLIFVACALVDISCANLLSEDAVIGITVACSIHTLMFSAHNVFARALRVVGSRYYGAGETNREKSLLSTTVILSVSIAFIIALVMYIFGRNILSLFALTEPQLDLAFSYLQFRMIGYVIYAFANPIIRSVETHGKNGEVTRVRLINLINVPLSIILAKVMGITGIGLGTTITELSELLLVLIVFRPVFGRPKLSELPEIAKLGLSYMPECLCSPLINSFATNMCLIYLNTSTIVISQLVNSFYDQIVEVIHMTTQQAEITIGREYGAKNQAGIATEFKKFRHCYIYIVLWHFPITMLVGWLYLGMISPVSNLGFALLLLVMRVLSAIVYYVGMPAMRILYVFDVIRPVMITRLIGLCVLQLLTQWIALKCGVGAFCIPISYFSSDVLWGITNIWLLRKYGFLREHGFERI